MNVKTYKAYGMMFMDVAFKDYLFNDEIFTVRQDFWNVFDACPNAEAISEGSSLGIGMDNFTLNYSNCVAVSSSRDKFGEAMLVSRPNMVLN